jgi:hypothetical protein
VYDEKSERIKFLDSKKNSFSTSKFVALSKNITINVLIEYWINGSGSVLQEVTSTNQFSIRYCEDTTAPVITISSDGLHVGDSLFTRESFIKIYSEVVDDGSGVDSETLYLSVNGARTKGSLLYARACQDTPSGISTVLFEASDMLGNVTEKTIYFGQDLASPVVTITKNPASGWTNGSAVILMPSATDRWAGLDPNTWQYSTDDGSTWSAEGAAGQLSITKDGRNKIRFKVKDKLGNTATALVECGIDKQAPVMSITAYPSKEWADWPGVSVTASASDSLPGLNTNSWQYSTDGGSTWSAEGTTRQLTITTEGRNDIRFRVKDLAGNTVSAAIVCGFDATPPVISITGVPSNEWTNGPAISVTASGSDSLSGINASSWQYSTDGGASWSAKGTTKQVAITKEGRSDICFRVSDLAGNTNQADATVAIDRTPPVYTLDANGLVRREGSAWVIPVKVSGLTDALSGVDYASFKYALDGGTLTKVPGSFSASSFAIALSVASLSGGNHTIKLSGADKAGNTAERTISLSIDATPPAISGNSLLGDTANEAPWTNQDRFAYSIADTETGIKSHTVTVNTVLANGYVSAFSGYSDTGTALVFNSAAPDGTYQVSLKATDNANNVGEKIFYCRLDRTPPDISPTLIKSASRAVTIRGTDALSGLNSNSCWTSAVAGVSNASGYTVDLDDGMHEKEFTLRDIAGNSVTKKVTIYIEQGPPRVTVTASEYGSDNKLPVTISITTVIMSISEVWHTIDGAKTVLAKANWNSAAIPLASYTEGIHTIKVGARNEAGVSGESAALQFIIDRTAPQLKGYELRDAANPEHVIAEGEYIPGGALLVKIAGEDLYNNGAKQNQGIIQYYSWAITRRLSDTPAFSSDKQSAGNEFTVQNFSDGLSYLCVRAEDGAGNFSQILKIPVLQDQSSPGAPVIKSFTHAEASRVEQAGFLSRAEFSFAPALGVKSGIRAYQWKVEKLYILNNNPGSATVAGEGETGAIDQEGRSGLSFELADNDENEFYQLLARCVGGNGKAGPWTTYRFRIDSEAPVGLLVQAVPQADSSSWYNQWDALVRWNKPRDMTGVAEYRHILIDEDENRISPLEGRDTSSWSKTADTQIRMNLLNVLGAKKSGALRIGVSAVDYAGNSKLGQLSFGYDFVPPRFNQSALAISNAEDALGAGKRIRWGGMKDDESGPDRVVILVSSDDTTSAFTVGPELTEYVVSPLAENKTFTVVIRAYDRAGNRAELYDVCATGNAAIPSVYFIPYLETIKGYDISGKKRVEGGNISFDGLTLQIPEGLELFSIVNSNGVKTRNRLGEIPLGTISATDGIFQTGRSGGGTYELRSGGFTLEASALSFSSEGGLDLENTAYIRPVIVSGAKQERRISLGIVNAGSPPLMQFSSDSAAVGAEARIESVCGENSGEAQNGFALTGVDSLFLSDGREWFEGAGISFDRQPLAGMAIHLEGAQGEAPLRNSAMEAQSSELVALLDISAQKPLTLSMGGAVYRVNRAGIRGNLLDIYEAVLPLPEGYEPPELTVRNITIDTRSKVVLQGPDFSTGAIAVAGPDGVEFEVTTIRFDSQGNLLVTGSISSQAYGIYRAEDIILSNTGIDWEAGAEITGFSTEVHGFLLSAQKARVTASGILISEGTIDVWGNQQTVAALGLKADRKNVVWQEGIIAGTFYGDPGYGAPVQIGGGRVARDGVFANAAIPLGDGIVDTTGAKHWTLPEARLYPNFVMAGSFAGEKSIVVANTPVRVENCFFDEQGLRIGKARVEHIPNLTPETASFTGMGLTYQGISVEGVSENNFLFAASGWQISYASLGFDGQGIKGRGSLALPEKLGGSALVLQNSRITADGLLVSGNPDETREILRFQGMSVFAGGVGLKLFEGAHVLELASPLLFLQPINGPDIFFGKTIFNAEGRVLLGEKETRKIDFTSFNGYRIGLENSGIDDQGFFLEGTIFLRLFGKDVIVPGGTYRVLPDFSVTGTGPGTGLSYSFGDWSINGGDIAFDADRIRIGSNRIVFREIEFDLGEIPFSLDGGLAQNVVRKQELGVSLFGAGAKISETRLSEEGIEATALITLPSVLGGKSFSFDKVGLKATGSFGLKKKWTPSVLLPWFFPLPWKNSPWTAVASRRQKRRSPCWPPWRLSSSASRI